jgi:recombination protein RecT
VEASKRAGNERADIQQAATQVTEFRRFIDSLKPNIVAAIGKWTTPDMLVSMFYSAVRANPDLMRCSATSLAGCILQSAQLRLRLDPVLGQAYMIPFRNKNLNRLEAQFIPGYRGFIAKMVDDKRIIAIDAQVVRDKDDFYMERGGNLTIRHKLPRLGDDRGEVIGAYAVAYGPGMKILQFEVMDIHQLEVLRAQSKNKEGSAYREHTDEMYRKAPIRRLFKLLPFVNEEISTMVALDEMGIEGHAQDLSIENLDAEGKPILAPWELVGEKEEAVATATAETKSTPVATTETKADEAEKARQQAQVAIYLSNKMKEPANIDRLNDVRQEIDMCFVENKISKEDRQRLFDLAQQIDKAAIAKKNPFQQ